MLVLGSVVHSKTMRTPISHKRMFEMLDVLCFFPRLVSSKERNLKLLHDSVLQLAIDDLNCQAYTIEPRKKTTRIYVLLVAEF